MEKLTPKQSAENFVSACKKYGWNYSIKNDSVICISKRFTAGDNDKLVECDMEYYSVLSHAPLKGGSVWGTDCGGIGALSALKSGNFVMNKSGSGGKRFMAALRKM